MYTLLFVVCDHFIFPAKNKLNEEKRVYNKYIKWVSTSQWGGYKGSEAMKTIL
jgi:hypothetical protein